jgi:hypothetical protein
VSDAVAVSPKARFRRRVALAFHVFLQACVVAGSQGPWWDVFVKSQHLFHQAGYDGARTPPMLPLAAVTAFAALAAFFFASYDLAADADLQLPILLASAVVLVCAGVLLHDVKFEPDTLLSVIDEVERAGLPPGGDVAPVTSEGGLHLRDFTLKPCWGLALVVAAAPLMVLVSLYLTFLIERAPEST